MAGAKTRAAGAGARGLGGELQTQLARRARISLRGR